MNPRLPQTRPGTARETRHPAAWVRVAWLLAVFLCLACAAGLMYLRVSRKVSSLAPSHPVTPEIPPGPADLFEDATRQAGIDFVHQFCDTRIANIILSNGAGGTWLDYNGDGWPDLYLVNSGPLDGVTHHQPGTRREPNRLYQNLGNGRFQDVTFKAGVGGAGFGTAAIAGDYDNDGHVDLFVVNIGKSILYRNHGDGTFEDVTEKAGVSNDGGTGIGAVFLDADRDGKLDLFVANYLTYDPNFKSSFHPESPYPGPLAYAWQYNRLYRNRGDGTFEDASERAGIRIPGHRAMSVATFDYNRDGAQDIYVLNDGTPNHLLVNDGHGVFKEAALRAGVALNAMGEAAGSMAATMGDCNGDGLMDLFVTRLGYGSMYVAETNGLFVDRMMASGLGALTRRFVGWGGTFGDFDNDGDPDLFIANGDALYLIGSESLLLENRGDCTFTDAGAKGGAFFKTKIAGRGSAAADYDNDGNLDLIVTAIADRPFLLHNRGSAAGHNWLILDLQGTRSNRDGFGALVTVEAGGRRFFGEARCSFSFLMQSDRRLHFGLGKADRVSRIEIRWPSGSVQELNDLAANQVLKVREPGG